MGGHRRGSAARTSPRTRLPPHDALAGGFTLTGTLKAASSAAALCRRPDSRTLAWREIFTESNPSQAPMQERGRPCDNGNARCPAASSHTDGRGPPVISVTKKATAGTGPAGPSALSTGKATTATPGWDVFLARRRTSFAIPIGRFDGDVQSRSTGGLVQCSRLPCLGVPGDAVTICLVSVDESSELGRDAGELAHI